MDTKDALFAERLCYRWVFLSVMSLVFAGVFAMLVAMARTPYIEDILPLGRDYIYVALVGHVVLAVVVWFLAFEGFLLNYAATICIGRPVFSHALGNASLASGGIGIGLIVAASVLGLGRAYIANYIPVLLTPVFYAGLGLFGLGVLLNLINALSGLFKARLVGVRLPFIAFSMAGAGIAISSAFACFLIAGMQTYKRSGTIADFEVLFWGGGHMLQFANAISMVSAWVILAWFAFKRDLPLERLHRPAIILFIVFVSIAPFAYSFHDAMTQENRDAFTNLMRYGMGASILFFIAGVLWTAIEARAVKWKDPAFSSLVLSVLVFSAGAIIAVGIRGVNTKIPAHYHCAIGAVTIAFMGAFYKLMPKAFGLEIRHKGLAVVQPYIYSLGVLVFAVGLYIAGSHGVERKVYGGAQNLDNAWKVMGMAIMGIGGLVAIIGGVAFAWNAILTLLGGRGSLAVKEGGLGDSRGKEVFRAF